jgi:hypothetical protein
MYAFNDNKHQFGAHALLKEHKQSGASFSDVILEHFGNLRKPAQTAGELLDRLESLPPPRINEERLKLLGLGRGRRSARGKQ